jgi:hypothetical protein
MGYSAAKCSHPHGAVRVYQQVLHGTAFKSLHRRGPKRRNLDSIKAQEAGACGQPEITVGSLIDPAHRLDTGVAPPRSVSVLRDLIRGIQRRQWNGDEQSTQKPADPTREPQVTELLVQATGLSN